MTEETNREALVRTLYGVLYVYGLTNITRAELTQAINEQITLTDIIETETFKVDQLFNIALTNKTIYTIQLRGVKIEFVLAKQCNKHFQQWAARTAGGTSYARVDRIYDVSDVGDLTQQDPSIV